MRVAHLLPAGIVGGAEIATARLLSELASAGVENIAYVPRDGEVVASLLEDHVQALEKWSQPGPWLSEIGEFSGESFRLAKRFRSQGADIVHCSKLAAAQSVGAIAAKLANKPVVAHVHLPARGLHPRVRRLLSLVDQFVFVSSRARDESELWGRLSNSAVVHNGVSEPAIRAGLEEDRDIRAEFGISTDAFLLTMVARLSLQKDFATLAEAMQRVVDVRPDTHLLVVGDGPPTDARRIRARFDERSLNESVSFAGFRKDVLTVIRDSDAVVLSTHTEGLPLVLLESMALARPVVATAVGGIPELVQSEKTGLLVEHEDAVGLACAILQLVDRPGRASELGQNGRARVLEHFTLEEQAKQIRRIYDNLLQ